MACFARKLRYGFCVNEPLGFSFILLAELAKKKGGRPVGFVLYRQNSSDQTEMIRFNAETAEEAVRRFWHPDAHREPQTGNEFPNQWEETAPWLDLRGVRPGTWTRVCIPRRRRRRRKPLQVGNISHVLLKHQAQLPELLRERSRVQLELDTIVSYDEDGDNAVEEDDNEKHVLLLETLAEIDERIAFVVAEINRTKDEMRYIVRKMFPHTTGIIPKRILRYERERKRMLAW